MLCLICNADVSSNVKLKAHLMQNHNMTPPEYFDQHPTASKICSKCKRERPITEFFKDQGNTYGYRAQCIHCMRTGGSKKSCPICGRTMQWAGIVTHMKNDHDISPVDAYNVYLKEKYCPHCKQYKPLTEFSPLENPDQAYFSWCKSCNFERNVVRSVGDQEFNTSMVLLTRLAFSDKCFICGLSHDQSIQKTGIPLQIDHLKPSIDGEALTIVNVLLLCRKCNLKKGTKDFVEFFTQSFQKINEYEYKLSELKRIQAWLKDEYKRLIVYSHYKFKSVRAGSSVLEEKMEIK